MFVTEVNDRVQAVSDLIEIPVPPVASIEEARGKEVYGNRDKYKDAMAKSGQMDSIATIIDLINSQVKKSS